MAYTSKSRDERLLDIVIVLADSGEKMTATDIAKVLGMTPSSHLRNMLSELVSEGSIEVQSEPYRNNVRFVFWVES